MQILDLQPHISKSFSRSLQQFFLTAGQNNFDKKIPFLHFENFFKNKNKKLPNIQNSTFKLRHVSKLPNEILRKNLNKTSVIEEKIIPYRH